MLKVPAAKTLVMATGPTQQAARRLQRRAKAARKRRAQRGVKQALLSGARESWPLRPRFLSEVVREDGVVGANGRRVKRTQAARVLGQKVWPLREQWRKEREAYDREMYEPRMEQLQRKEAEERAEQRAREEARMAKLRSGPTLESVLRGVAARAKRSAA